jgi:hypothetical protein
VKLSGLRAGFFVGQVKVHCPDMVTTTRRAQRLMGRR